MSRKKSTVWALAAAMLLSAAPAAMAHGDHAVVYGTPAVVRVGAAPAAGHWHGNTYYGAGKHWGGSIDAQLFAAAANGDLWGVKRLVERGANVDARDAEGLTPLAWAAQYGRADVATYLIQQHANLNPADKYGFTPLMWAAQEGHQSVLEVLLTKGANPRVVTRNGITALTLARYSGSWRTASALENWLEGRRTQAAPARAVSRPVAPVRVTVVARPSAPPPAPAAPVAAAPAPEPGMIAKATAFKRLAETGAQFGEDYLAWTKASASGGLGLNTLTAMTSPDMETGKALTSFFATIAKTQDLKAARADLDKAKASLAGNAQPRFARYVTDAEKALVEAGF
jgi:hypothetical protein